MNLDTICLTQVEFLALPISTTGSYNDSLKRYQCPNGQWLMVGNGTCKLIRLVEKRQNREQSLRLSTR